MTYSAKSRRPVGARLRVEHLECRTQPGSILPFSEFSLMGASLFDTDPLSGQQLSTTSDASLLAVVSEETGANDFSPTTLRLQVPGAPVSEQSVSQTAAPTEARQLQMVAGSRIAPSTPTAPVANAAPAPVQAQVTNVQQAPVVSFPQLQVIQHTTDDSVVIQEGIDLWTGFNGVVGNDVGRATVMSDAGVGFYAGYTERAGNRDIMVWATDLYNTFGSVRLWETVLGSTGTGADEATGLFLEGSTLYVSATMPGTNGSAAVLLRLNPATGAQIGTPVGVDGPGNDRMNDVNGYLFGGGIIVATGALTTATDTLIYSGTFAPDLTPYSSVGLGLMGITQQSGDAITMNYAAETYIAGQFDQGGSKAVVVKDFFGTPAWAGFYDVAGGRMSGVDFDLNGTNTLYLTGEIPQTTPTPHTRMLIGKWTDNGATFAQVWAFIWTYQFGQPPVLGNLAGNHMKADFDGTTYVICELWGPGVNRDTGDNDAMIFKVGPNGNTQADFYFYSAEGFEALGNDKGFGLGYNILTFGVTTAGKSNSTNTPPGGFPVSSYAYQTVQADNGALSDAFAGWNYLPGV